MSNIFKQAQQVNEHPKRNNFDLSKKINASFKFGTLYPVYCQPVVPGDSFSIDTAFNIKAMPVVFPVQTKMRAHMHYFYVRNKNLWKNFENWISNLPNATQSLTPHPYISRPDSEFSSGSIHDFLGVPTSLASDSPIPVVTRESFSDGIGGERFLSQPYGFSTYAALASAAATDGTFPEFTSSISLSSRYAFQVFDGVQYWSLTGDLSPEEVERFNQYSIPDSYFRTKSSLRLSNMKSLAACIGGTVHSGHKYLMVVSEDIGLNEGHYEFTHKKILAIAQCDFDINEDGSVDFPFSDSDVEKILADDHNHYFAVVVPYTSIGESVDITDPETLVAVDKIPSIVYTFPAGFVDYPDLNLDLYSNHLHINALPYRAYTSIVNAYYRNTVVDPLIVNGQVQYNKFIPNDGNGADTYKYELAQRNYELDFLTSALPSPQQGVAPMVGVTALGDITIEDENGITTARTESDEAGFVTKVILTSPAASNEHARTLMNIAASGFNINDFRNTNALQRFLETSIRKGYKYKDFIAGHFGVEPKYVELDMPEFIGGFSRDVNVSTVISNADTLSGSGDDSLGAALGEYGGYCQVVGGSRHSVRHYCDDYGFIMGIMCIVPTPCYSQLLPKHMVAPDNFLDYYFAEFSNIGMQPITYKEVAPIQSYLESIADPSKSLEDTFGYQRPNYDMVSAVDEVHGDFRGNLRNYVINRIFSSRPELGHDFIAVRPEEVNDIFVNTDPRSDTFIGEIGFAVHAKRPVPRVVIPNLGK